MKKFLTWLLVLCLIGGGIYGGVNYYQAHNSNNKKPVEVMPVSYIQAYNYNNSSYSYGNIRSGASQSIYLQNNETIQEIFVEQGQEVFLGMPLLQYDMTLTELQIELKKLEMESL